jgi:hypothetical protein
LSTLEVAVTKPHAGSFVRCATDLVTIETLGDHAAFVLRSCAIQGAAEQLLMDIVKLGGREGGSASEVIFELQPGFLALRTPAKTCPVCTRGLGGDRFRA